MRKDYVPANDLGLIYKRCVMVIPSVKICDRLESKCHKNMSVIDIAAHCKAFIQSLNVEEGHMKCRKILHNAGLSLQDSLHPWVPAN